MCLFVSRTAQKKLLMIFTVLGGNVALDFDSNPEHVMLGLGLYQWLKW